MQTNQSRCGLEIDRVRLPADENTRIGGKKPQTYKALLAALCTPPCHTVATIP